MFEEIFGLEDVVAERTVFRVSVAILILAVLSLFLRGRKVHVCNVEPSKINERSRIHLDGSLTT